MLEIELKILDIDTDAVVQKLLDLGATKGARQFIREEAFDFPDDRIRAKDDVFRLRTIGEKIELVYKSDKQNAGGFQIAKEDEILVSDFDTTKRIIAQLGLTSYRSREKYRTTFTLGEVHVELDEYPKIPAYIEVEGSKEDIVALLAQLGLSMADTCDLTASQVIAQYGEDPYDLCFTK